jgi:hypothetical protein
MTWLVEQWHNGNYMIAMLSMLSVGTALILYVS